MTATGKIHEEVTDAHALVDKVPSGSTGWTECWSPTRWTGSHGIAPEVWINIVPISASNAAFLSVMVGV